MACRLQSSVPNLTDLSKEPKPVVGACGIEESARDGAFARRCRLVRRMVGRGGRWFTIWMAGGGIKPGLVYGETDDYCYNVVENPVHIHDFNATVLRCLGIDHEKLTFKFQGRHFRLTDVHGEVVKGILA